MKQDSSPIIAARCFALAMGLMTLLVTLATEAADRFAELDSYVYAAMTKWDVPGLAIAVVKEGELVLVREYGECEVGTGRKVNTETVFPIASCSKSLTSAALGLLVDEGKLRWDDPVASHLPDFELSDPYLTEHVTVRDLLCHRTGLRRADLLQDGTGFDDEEVMHRLKHLDSVAELRTRLIYNNHAYTVLNELVTRVSGCPFEQFVDQRLLEPLNMKLLPPHVMPKHHRAARHWRSDNGIVAREVSQTDGPYATARDLAQWLRLHLADGTFSGRELLKAETVREMHALQFSEPARYRTNDNVYAAQFYGAGLGWFVQDYRGHKIVLHSGAWGAMMGMIPEEKIGVVVLSNLDLESLPAMLMYDVFDAYLVGPE
jgi:CubicO group peptidase (beta-lactamase class C family)